METYLDDYAYRDRDEYYIKQIVSALSNSLDVRIKPQHCQWASNIENQELYYDPCSLKNLYGNEIFAIILHEVSHLRYTGNVKKESKYLDKYEALMHLYNAIEDFRIEAKLEEDYPVAKDYFWDLQFPRLPNMEESVKGDVRKDSKYIQYVAASFLHLAGYEAVEKMIEDKEVREAFEKTKDSISQAYLQKSSAKLIELTDKEIVPVIEKFLKDFKDNKNGQGPGKGDGDIVSDCAGMKANDGEKGDKEGKSGYVENCDAQHGYGPTEGTHEDHETTNLNYQEIKKELQPLINTYANRFNSILKDNAYDRYEGRYRTGALNERRLYQHSLGKFNLFQRKNDVKNKNYEIILLVDESGSMAHGNNVQALKSSIFLTEVFTKLKIPHSIYGFNGHYYSHKTKEQGIDPKMKRSLMDIVNNTHNYYAGYNCDGHFLLEAFKEFTNLDNEKILMVISDGHPAECGSHENRDLKASVRKVMNTKVKLIGIGVGDSGVAAVKQYYPKHVIVKDSTELPNKLMGVVKGMLHRRVQA